MGSFPFPRNGILKIDYEFILIFKKHGAGPKASKDIKEQSKMSTEEWNRFFTGHWNIPGEKQDKHLAMFPEEVPRRLIRMFSFVGDTVLDPFLGSGTTTLAAKNLGRNSIGYEINPEFLPVIKEKLHLEEKLMFDQSEYEIARQDNAGEKVDVSPTQLPYVFKDPVQFDKKLDPRKLQFGSKINSRQSKREKYYSVKDVVSPEEVVVGNGLTVRLLGIKARPETLGEATALLRAKTHGQRVFMKFDRTKCDSLDRLLCYLYLQNKTFLNAHLVRSGLVDVDTSLDYSLKDKFLAVMKAK